jgi:hypothetical protein
MRVLTSKAIALLAVAALVLAACGGGSGQPTAKGNTGASAPSSTSRPSTGGLSTPASPTSVLPSPAVSGSTSLVSSSPLAVGAVLGPQAVVQSFYDWYVTSHDYTLLFVRPDVTPGFIQWYKTWTREVDPIICTQQPPDSVQAGTAVISGSSATVTTTEVWNGILQSPGSGPKVTLALGPVGWQISAVDCGFPPLP